MFILTVLAKFLAVSVCLSIALPVLVKIMVLKYFGYANNSSYQELQAYKNVSLYLAVEHMKENKTYRLLVTYYELIMYPLLLVVGLFILKYAGMYYFIPSMLITLIQTTYSYEKVLNIRKYKRCC